MTDTPMLNSPTTDGLTPMTEEIPNGAKVRMKKELGLLEGVAIILGIIFGSGEYINFD